LSGNLEPRCSPSRGLAGLPSRRGRSACRARRRYRRLRRRLR